MTGFLEALASCAFKWGFSGFHVKLSTDGAPLLLVGRSCSLEQKKFPILVFEEEKCADLIGELVTHKK